MKDTTQTQSLVEEFLAKGGQIERCPYRSPKYIPKNKDAPTKRAIPSREAFSPKEEAKALYRKAEARAKVMAEYRQKVIEAKVKGLPTPEKPVWED